MPRGDRSGPDGIGPMSGRAMGYCAGYDQPGFTAGPGGGRGRARGLGGRRRGFRGAYGRGFGPVPRYGYERGPGYPWAGETGYGPAYTAEERKAMLQDELQGLEGRIESLRREIESIDTEGSSEPKSG